MNYFTFTKRLKSSRTHKGFSQKELAEKAGVSQGLISKYESKIITVSPKVDTIYALSRALEVSCEYLLGIDKEITKNPLSEKINLQVSLKKVENYSSPNVKRIFDYIRMPVENPVDFFIQNDNDEMYPLLKSRGFLFFMFNDRALDNKIILFRKKGEENNRVRFCKINENINLMSPNPDIGLVKLSLQDFKATYFVMGILTGYWDNIHGQFGQDIF